MGGFYHGSVNSDSYVVLAGGGYKSVNDFLLSQDHYKTSPGAGTAGTSSATSGSTLSVPYVTVNANGHVTGYGTHTHTITGFLTALDHYKTSPGAGTAGTSSATSGATLTVPYVTVNANGHITGYGTHTHSVTAVVGSYTLNGGQQNPNYFGKNRVGFLMMNTTVNGNSNYKDWIIMDCYSGNDVGGGVAIGVNRQSLGAYIMRSAAARTSWDESAELIGTHNYTSYCATAGHTHTLKIEADSGTPNITLSANTTYKLTAGGSTYLFKTPTDLTGSGGDGDTKYYLTLNGTNKGHTSGTNLGSFYAPTSAGTSGQYLKSNGSGAPTWASFDFASSGHSHTLKIEANSGTPSITLSANTTYKLTAGGSTYLFKTPADLTGGGGGSVSIGSVTSGTYQVVGVDTSNTSTLKYLATSGGHFYFTPSGAYHTSDERMKHDIWDILQDDVDTLFGTNNGYIRHFAWNSNDVEAYGFIALELEEFCPEAIHINEDGYYGVNYNVAFSKILGAMFKKIKQQDKEIKKLKKIIEKHK